MGGGSDKALCEAAGENGTTLESLVAHEQAVTAGLREAHVVAEEGTAVVRIDRDDYDRVLKASMIEVVEEALATITDLKHELRAAESDAEGMLS